MTTEAAIVAALAALLGSVLTGVGGKVIDWFRSREEREASAEEKHHEELKAQNDSLKRQVKQLQNKLEELRAQVLALTDRIDELTTNRLIVDLEDVFAALMNSNSHPCWVHNITDNVWFMNDAYKRHFKTPRRHFWAPVDILGSLPADRSASYIKNDMRALEAGRPLIFREAVPRRLFEPVNENNPADVWRVRKTPVSSAMGSYVIGECLEIEGDIPPVTDAEALKLEAGRSQEGEAADVA